jgi:hypothetical protein
MVSTNISRLVSIVGKLVIFGELIKTYANATLPKLGYEMDNEHD